MSLRANSRRASRALVVAVVAAFKKARSSQIPPSLVSLTCSLATFLFEAEKIIRIKLELEEFASGYFYLGTYHP